MKRADVGVFLAHVVIGIGVVRPVQACLQTIVSCVHRCLPDKRGKRRALGGAFSAEVDYCLTDQSTAWPGSETEVSEINRKARSWRVIRIVPDAYADFLFRVPFEHVG